MTYELKRKLKNVLNFKTTSRNMCNQCFKGGIMKIVAILKYKGIVMRYKCGYEEQSQFQ